MSAQIEYLGFTSQAATRQYTLRVRLGAGEPQDIRLAIPNEVFLARRLRYQDAPEICFLKVQREIVACNGGLPSPELTVTDADLASYREAHAPKPTQRRPKPA